jgi:hypothetical protein
MLDTIDVTSKFLALFTGLYLMMTQMDYFKTKWKFITESKWLALSIVLFVLSSGCTVIIDWTLSDKAKDDSIKAQKQQIDMHNSDEKKADERQKSLTIHIDSLVKVHKNDSIIIAKYKEQEPYLDLTKEPQLKNNPEADFVNDTADFEIEIQNFENSPAKNVNYTCIFINPNGIDLYIGDIMQTNRNMTITFNEVLNMSFFKYIPKKLPNAFYVYFKMTYTDLQDKPQKPVERIYLRNKNGGGEKCLDVTDNDFVRLIDVVYNRYPSLK